MKVVRVYTGDDNQSHFEDIDLPFAPDGPGELTPPLSTNLVFSRRAPGGVQDWHCAPRRQYVISLSGLTEIEIGDLNGDGVGDPDEDVNNDGNVDGLDCLGPDGPQGPAGPTVPIIQSLSVSGVPADPGGTVTVAVAAQSAQDLALSYEWSLEPDTWIGFRLLRVFVIVASVNHPKPLTYQNSPPNYKKNMFQMKK